MGKSKRIAIGGWLNNTLSIATRGWFGSNIPLGARTKTLFKAMFKMHYKKMR